MEIKLAEHIRAERRARGMTQEQLAEALGVTVGAVYKWESGQSVPELRLLVELAELFEVSVDALLGYGWVSGSMGEAVKTMRALCAERRFDEGIRVAEKALTRYPNSFAVVYRSAMLYSLRMDKRSATRAVELFERACRLIEQNEEEDEEVSLWSIRNKIAECYIYMEKYEKAVELLKQNNAGGINNSEIGAILAQHMGQAEGALPYLSTALVHTQTVLYRITLGYANAYLALGRVTEAREIALWLYNLTQGLRVPGEVTYMEKTDAWVLMLIAETYAIAEDACQAEVHLRRARAAAQHFDRAPNYSMRGLKFYHGPDASVFDDFGEMAMEGLAKSIADEDGAPELRPIWAKLEEEDHDA